MLSMAGAMHYGSIRLKRLRPDGRHGSDNGSGEQGMRSIVIGCNKDLIIGPHDSCKSAAMPYLSTERPNSTTLIRGPG